MQCSRADASAAVLDAVALGGEREMASSNGFPVAQPASGPSHESRVDGQAGASATPPSISLPKGGGAIRGIGEKFTANPVTGTGSMSVPIATSPGRAGFGPQLSLAYDSGA